MSRTSTTTSTTTVRTAVAGATTTYRSDRAKNQDVVIALTPEADGCAAVVVADGVGSWSRSGEIARAAADAAAVALRFEGPRNLTPIFKAAYEAVAARKPGPDDAAPDHGATTLLVATHVPGEGVRYGYVGNGGVFAVVPVSGVAASSPFATRFTNLLLPHSGFKDGREVLTRFLSTAATRMHQPSFGTIASDGAPMALALVTDGVFSEEQYPLATTSDGTRWSERPELLIRTLDFAAEQLARFAADDAMDDLVKHVENLLSAWTAEGLLFDDTTLGLLFV